MHARKNTVRSSLASRPTGAESGPLHSLVPSHQTTPISTKNTPQQTSTGTAFSSITSQITSSLHVGGVGSWLRGKRHTLLRLGHTHTPGTPKPPSKGCAKEMVFNSVACDDRDVVMVSHSKHIHSPRALSPHCQVARAETIDTGSYFVPVPVPVPVPAEKARAMMSKQNNKNIDRNIDRNTDRDKGGNTDRDRNGSRDNRDSKSQPREIGGKMHNKIAVSGPSSPSIFKKQQSLLDQERDQEPDADSSKPPTIPDLMTQSVFIPCTPSMRARSVKQKFFDSTRSDCTGATDTTGASPFVGVPVLQVLRVLLVLEQLINCHLESL